MKIPVNVIREAEKLLDGLMFGSVAVYISVHDGRPKYRLTKEVSVIPGNASSGGADARKD